ncbi:alpha/beta hydrolase [Actinokineospora sp. HUAS TT18]|uniref:alpha/beta hydrolase n=1 Tax=Actinokineospora sp. HUAS TT18 TaxID=3447451 RepID=UPI003F526E89
MNEKLGGLDTIEKRLTSPQAGQQQAYLLGIDSSGNGRAIVAIGNPDTAANVATFVPGTGARLGTCGTDIGRSDSMVDAAAQAGSPSTASITWIGYDAPQDLVAAADEDYAQNARQDLDRFQDGLRATHQGAPSHNTVIGHSYGSTVIGHTARDMDINADEVVFVGSPGVGVSRAEDLGLPPGNVHSTVAEHDVIQVTNVFEEPFDVHGPDPAEPTFGGNVFTSDPGTSSWTGYSTEAHSQYWDRENQALENMGRIIAGKPTI